MKTGNRNVISANMAERKGSAERSAQSDHFREGLMRENFEKMKEEDLLNYLRKMRGMEKELPKRRKELLRRMLSYEDCIYSKSFPQAFEKQMGSGSVREEDTLHQILVNVYKEMGEQLTSVSEEMAGIFRQERQLDWMQKCIQKLPAEQSDLIWALFVEGKDREEYIKETYISPSTFFRRRRKAVSQLLKLYNAGC